MPKGIAKVMASCYGCGEPFCRICNECHIQTCKLVDKSITTRSQMLENGLVQPRTQKALGFKAMVSSFGMTVPGPFVIVTEEQDIPYALGKVKAQIFVRPCPVRPRHGFVESRKVEATLGNVKQIWDEARQADPEAELIICSPIDSDISAVITPSMLSVGPGNDGATGGRNSISYPLMGVLPDEFTYKTEALFDIGVDVSIHDPYVELVRTKSIYNSSTKWLYTQIRAGAKTPKTPDYVPYRMQVESVIEASGNLLDWERQIAQIKAGSVVVHIGGTLISHYGVHCLTNKVPIFTTRTPLVGEWLEPMGHIVEHDPESYIKGLALGGMIPIDRTITLKNGTQHIFSIRDLLPLMMTTLHNAPAMGNGWGMWVGFATAIMLRAGTAAAHGEARHADRALKQIPRSTIFDTAFNDFFGSRTSLSVAQHAFLNYKWSSSFGGKAWASCTQSILDLDQMVRDLIRNPTESNRAALVTQLNIAVNQAHNGGWWLNKFIEQSYFDEASKQSFDALLKVANVLIPLSAYAEELFSQPEWKRFVLQWSTEPDIEVEGKGDYKVVDLDDEDYFDNPPAEVEEPEPDEESNVPELVCKGISGEGDCSPENLCEVCEMNPYIEDNKAYKTSPIPKKSSKGKLFKVKPHPNYNIEKAHIRFEKDGTGHIQMVVGYGEYCSININFSEAETESIDKHQPRTSTLIESSYSSDATGYLNLDILHWEKTNKSDWIFFEPVTGIKLKWNGQTIETKS